MRARPHATTRPSLPQPSFNRNGAHFETGSSGPSNYLQAFIGNQTIPWLRTAAAAAAAGGAPFFAYLAPHAPHFPAEPAPWYADAPLPRQTAPRTPAYDALVANKSWAIRANPALSDHPFTADGVDLHFRNRQRSLMSVDDYVAAIFAELEGAGVLDSTYVIATSDHGGWVGWWVSACAGRAARGALVRSLRRHAPRRRRTARPLPPSTSPAAQATTSASTASPLR